jgi:histidinol-phosphate aminotransferase
MHIEEITPHYIQAISPYVPGKPISDLARELHLDESTIVKLASNENPLGPSPRALAAISHAAAELTRYPDGAGFDLKAALARRFDLEPGQIILGNGSNDVLELIAHAFLHRGVSSVFSQHAFAVYPLATQGYGATGIEVPAAAYGHDLVAMRAAIRDDTRVVWIANPNNPTGTWVPPADLHRFVHSLPEDVLLVLDEAYNEYLPEEKQTDTTRWLEDFPNLILVRTFSKAYGLAALRVGYGLMHPSVADMLNRVRQPFNVNALAQAAAIAALEDTAYVEASCAANRRGMEQLEREFRARGLTFIRSHGNFVTVKVGDAARVNRALLEQGVIVRPVANYGLPEFLRVTIGTEAENARFLDALAKALPAA